MTEILDVQGFVRSTDGGREEIVGLVQEIFPNANGGKLVDSHRIFPKYVALKRAIFSGKRVVGFIFWKLMESDDGSTYALVDHVGVKDGFRRRGIGTALVRYSMKEIRSKRDGCDVMIHCRKNNDAKFFYDELGFETVDLIDGYYANGDPAYEMVLRSEKRRLKRAALPRAREISP